MGGWMDSLVDGWKGGRWMNRWIVDRWMDGQLGEWMERWKVDEQMDSEVDSEVDGWVDGWIAWWMDGKVEGG